MFIVNPYIFNFYTGHTSCFIATEESFLWVLKIILLSEKLTSHIDQAFLVIKGPDREQKYFNIALVLQYE